LKFKVGDVIEPKLNQRFTKEIKNIDWLNEQYIVPLVTSTANGSIKFSKQDDWQLYKEPTAEEEANKLGFKIGDKAWKPSIKQYRGEICEFYYEHGVLCVQYKGNANWDCIDGITNKVAVHTPTEEDFEFINNKPNINIISWKDCILENDTLAESPLSFKSIAAALTSSKD